MLLLSVGLTNRGDFFNAHADFASWVGDTLQFPPTKPLEEQTIKEFRDRVGVIIGWASDIGRGLAGRCAQEGMKVVLADVDRTALSQASFGPTPDRPRDLETSVGTANTLAPESFSSCSACSVRFLLFNNEGGDAQPCGKAPWQIGMGYA
jgi:hypothetical protein